MLQWMLMIMMMISNLLFMSMKHPLAMGLTLLIQTSMTSMLTGLMTKNYWFSYILFLILLGGMLVLFIYMTSLASNEMFTFSSKIIMFMLILFNTAMIIYLNTDSNLMIQYKNLEMNSIYKMDTYYTENALSLNKLYNYPTNFMTIMLMNYLLITLIAVVKITKLFKGPLRSSLN
uniref:NADH dehydrogenase subunit 6 n=1 Tax=Halidaya aurea TaxID=1918247 RepID=UPI002000B5AD|nr:NADH dehydrogenase subunit 6 [Halidaya aurea]UOW81233.1 NADH dehydrogenase subunit 6 [Halidaya aurea]